MIRRAILKDIPKINDLLRQVNYVHYEKRKDIFKMGNKYTDKELEALIQNDQRPIFVLTNNQDEVLGYVFCIIEQHLNNQLLTDIKTLYIDDFCVDEICRGQHLGTQLYDYVKEYAKSIGCYNITLNVWSLNESAKKFYEHLGLIPQKIKMEDILKGKD